MAIGSNPDHHPAQDLQSSFYGMLVDSIRTV